MGMSIGCFTEIKKQYGGKRGNPVMAWVIKDRHKVRHVYPFVFFLIFVVIFWEQAIAVLYLACDWIFRSNRK